MKILIFLIIFIYSSTSFSKDNEMIWSTVSSHKLCYKILNNGKIINQEKIKKKSNSHHYDTIFLMSFENNLYEFYTYHDGGKFRFYCNKAK